MSMKNSNNTSWDRNSDLSIFRWYARFKSGVETIEDEARPGRPFSVRNEGLMAKVRKRIQDERCVTVRMSLVLTGRRFSNLSGRLGQEKGRFTVCAACIV